MSRLLAPFATSVALFISTSNCSSNFSKNEIQELKSCLSAYRKDEQQMRKRWEDDEEFGLRKLPPRAWPPYQPDVHALDGLKEKVEACQKAKDPDNSDCQTAMFDLASCLAFNNLDGEKALEYYQKLSNRGHIDGTVAVGIMLMEGLGVEAEAGEAQKALEKAVHAGSAQACYELGTAVYTGVVTEIVPEPGAARRTVRDANEEALSLFLRATEVGDKTTDKQHSAASFMAGDMLIEAEGCTRDIKRGIPLLMHSAEVGHRYARQKARHLLDLAQ